MPDYNKQQSIALKNLNRVRKKKERKCEFIDDLMKQPKNQITHLHFPSLPCHVQLRCSL